MVVLLIITIMVILILLFVNLNLHRQYCIEYGKALILEKRLENKEVKLNKYINRVEYLSQFLPEDDVSC